MVRNALARQRRTLSAQLKAEFFQALGDPTRLEILQRLVCASGPQTVTEISDCCGVHLSGVSRHLTCLRRAGIVQAAKEGREVRYEIDGDRLIGSLRALADALDACRATCCGA